MAIKSRAELYEIYKTSVQSQDAEGLKLTDWNEGSINDMLANAACLVASELQSTIVDEFNRTLLSNTAGADKDELATDHYGASFDRPSAVKASGIVKFSRPTAAYGAFSIPAGTTLESVQDANGDTQLFVTQSAVSFGASDLVVYASIEAVEAGPAGNLEAETITTIVDTLDDDIVVVTNEADTTGGAEELTDPEYQDWLGEKISASRGGSAPAIEARLLLVPGVSKAKVHESFVRVRAVDASGVASGAIFSTVIAKAYIIDANGTANAALLALAEEAIAEQRALGTNVLVAAAASVTIAWTSSITLDPEGPNYAELSADLTRIKNSMTDYIDSLSIGTAFDPILGNLAMLAIWGPSGTGDLSTFVTTTPTSKVQPSLTTKLIPGTMTLT